MPSATGRREKSGNRHVNIDKLQRVQQAGGQESNSIVASFSKEGSTILNPHSFIHVHTCSYPNGIEDNIMLQCVGPSCYALVIDLGTLCDDTIAPQNITGTRGCLDDPKALVMVRKWVASSSIDVVSMWRFPKMLLSPKLSVFIGFSIVNHSFWGTPIF